MGRGDELYQYGSWHADKKICDLKHCSVSCIYSRANTCIIRYAKIYNYHKRNINWSCLDGYVVCSSYDTIELAYSGAQIIHPKTIKPLQNKNIPLYVRPFGDKRKPGTVIRGMSAPVDVPILILKKDQVLLTIRSRDFSFVLEEKFATIFSLLERFRIKANLIHNSAVNLSLCVDNSWHIDEAIEALREAGFDVMKAENMELLTVRGYTDELWRRYARGPQVFVRQATQSTVRVVRKRE